MKKVAPLYRKGGTFIPYTRFSETWPDSLERRASPLYGREWYRGTQLKSKVRRRFDSAKGSDSRVLQIRLHFSFIINQSYKAAAK